MDTKADTPATSEGYRRFEELAKKLVKIPKKEIQERDKKTKKTSKTVIT